MAKNVPEPLIKKILDSVNRLGNLQLLLGRENLEKSNIPFAQWIQTRDSDCLAVGQQERIVDGMAATIRCPIPTMCVTLDRSRSTFDLDKNQARRPEDEEVDLVYSSLVVHEFEI